MPPDSLALRGTKVENEWSYGTSNTGRRGQPNETSNPQLAIKHRLAVFPHPPIMRRWMGRGASDKDQRRGGDTYARLYAEKMADTVPSVLGLF